MKCHEIIAALPKLSQTERDQIRAALDSLSVGTVEALDPTAPLFTELTRLLGIRRGFRDFHSTVAYKTWRRAAPQVLTFIEKTFPQAKRNARVAVTSFLLELLIDDMKGRGWPITLGRVVNNLDRLPVIFDESFPGYRQAGLAHLVLESMTKRKK